MELLNIHAIDRKGVRSLGPGLRYAIWLQGCPFDCDGCITPEAKPVVANKIYTIDSICKDIISSKCEGLTISGGEPFLQAEGLQKLLTTVHQARPNLTVIIFTGFLKENLLGAEALAVLKHTDLLIDGPDNKTFNDGKGLRGSSNQKFHFLTNRLLPWKEKIVSGKRSLEISFNNGIIESVGIPLNHNITHPQIDKAYEQRI